VYVAFAIDVFSRRFVGSPVSSPLRSDLGSMCFTDPLTPAQLTELAQHRKIGLFGAVVPEALSYESFSLGRFLLHETKTLIIATGIANIYARDATTAKWGQHTLAKLSGGRFLWGLGISHVPRVEDLRGHRSGKPLATMRAYLDAMDKAAATAPPLEDPPPTVLAALGPGMTVLAAARTAGAMPYNVTPEHTARTRALRGPDKWLCVEQKILLVQDPAKAREIARQTMAFYMPLPNYRNNWLRLGFSEDDLADGGSNRFLDAMVAWGEKSAVQKRIQEHFEAGASHVCIQGLHPDGQPRPDLNALAALAP
jgi:probable F420-dependent oxidoreductase